jgi:hypothetical protein
MQKIEKRLLEMELRINRYIYFKSKSQLKIYESIENEDFETAADERDKTVVFDQKIEECQLELLQLSKFKKFKK